MGNDKAKDKDNDPDLEKKDPKEGLELDNEIRKRDPSEGFRLDYEVGEEYGDRA